MRSARDRGSGSSFERELREVNEALLVSSVHQHELTEQAQRAEAALRKSEVELRLQAEELARFNRLVVGREARMIELKREINDLTQRLGQPLRYRLERELESEQAVDDSATELPPREDDVESHAGASGDIAPLEMILCTEELARRPSRPRDYRTENDALVSLTRVLADSPGEILQVLVQKILEVLQADSAGLNLLTADAKRFYWPAVAGLWEPHIGGGMPRDFGPGGDVLDLDAPQLFARLQRRYAYFRPVTPPLEEALIVPFYVDGKAVGVLWAVSHGERKFDAEDLRQLQNLERFASGAYRANQVRTLQESRRSAALNLLEDLVQSQQATERVNSELRASEERYRTLFSSIDEGFCVVEVLFDSQDHATDYRFVETNPAFEKHTGLHDVAGRRVRELSPHHEAQWFEKYGNVALTGESVRFVNEAHDLGNRWFDVYAFRLGTPERHRVAILFSNITERVLLEEKTQKQARSLADLNRRKDEFLAMLSHELRNPLASIQNAAHVLQLQRDLSPIQSHAHGMIMRQVSQLARLVDDLLEVSRISTGRVRLQMESVSLRGVIENACETIRTQMEQKAQSLTRLLPDEPLWVSGDPLRLEQVIVNLLNNASKYTDRGGTISVTLRREGDEAVLRVRDNGVGITPDMLPRIFELFTQADRSLDRAQGGLGIGLGLVQSLVTMHRGRVEAFSTVGQGSEFVVRLPLLLSVHEPPAAAERSGAASTRALKVLVVDDNIDAAQSITMLLQIAGHTTRQAHDGATALKCAREFLPDAVLLDIGLPGADGFQVARWIREDPALSNVLLVALTGYGHDTDKQRAEQAGFSYHLVKPVDFEKIENILSTVVGR